MSTISELEEKIKEYQNIIEKQNNEIEKLKKELQTRIETKTVHNERGAGRKAFSNSDTIKQIINKHGSGESLQKIADYLNEQKIKTARGGNWSKSSVKFILDNNYLVINNCTFMADNDKVYIYIGNNGIDIIDKVKQSTFQETCNNWIKENSNEACKIKLYESLYYQFDSAYDYARYSVDARTAWNIGREKIKEIKNQIEKLKIDNEEFEKYIESENKRYYKEYKHLQKPQ